MKKVAFEKKVLVILLAVLFAVISISFFVNNSLQSIVDKVSEDSQLDENVVLLKGMMVDISDAENSVKSYGLTKDGNYLDEYNLQINEVNKKILELGELVEPGTELDKDLPKIDSLVNAKFVILDELLLVQSQRSADLILNKVLEKVGSVNNGSTSETTTNSTESTAVDETEEKEKFFTRLFGNRKKKKEKEEAEMASTDTLGLQDVENVMDESFTKIDKELEELRQKETEFEVELKMKELELIQEDKQIMDEITTLVASLELADKKDREDKIAYAEAQRSSTKTHIILFCIFSCVLLILAGYVVYIYVKKNNAYKTALRAAKNESDVKNIEITASITYAKRIQSAIMPDDKKIASAFPNSFIYYKPKDIVAGDFYWMIDTADHVFIAVADCTGHGVPGAMVSVACSAALNRSVKEFGLRKPSDILGKCREIVIETFEEGNHVLYDGMDIALCKVDKKTGQMEYAGANNSLYLIRKGELTEVKADKQPVARFYKEAAFTNHTIEIQKDDCIYLFTDGFPDQFGGDKKKKFMYKRFKELLVKNSDRSPKDQASAIDHAFESWKGGMEQIDDVCVIGIRL